MIGGVVVAALVVGGPFVYINFIEGDPPAELSLDSQPAPGTAATAGGAAGGTAYATLDGTWKVASGSQAGYRVKEVLFGQDTTAVGRTSGVTGQLVVSGTTVPSADLTVDMTTVTSDQSQRDSQFRGQIMETSRFPTATFKLTRPIDLGSVPAEGEKRTYQATGDLTLHGVTRTVTISLDAQRAGGQIRASGQIPVTFRDYDVSPPNIGGIKVEQNGVIEVLLNFDKS
ncbi:YceI family protein [Candidatus Protofrankia californiensis]|uniref:YceI family protein n=1 Tax=Candidatus Protofrankia californiensis TaxID=1839754 RepID=A0A1C3NUV2_9ACTN|nr:YceI family protein [Candidatus Protofrankia californiensis]